MELINLFIDNVGKCERIFKTPIPAAYTRCVDQRARHGSLVPRRAHQHSCD